jgi:hypothetical protein
MRRPQLVVGFLAPSPTAQIDHDTSKQKHNGERTNSSTYDRTCIFLEI